MLHKLGGGVITQDEEKSEILSTIFVPVFNSTTSCPQFAQPHDLKYREQNETLTEQGGNNLRCVTPLTHRSLWGHLRFMQEY